MIIKNIYFYNCSCNGTGGLKLIKHYFNDILQGVFFASASNVTIISSIFDTNHANVDGGAFKIDSGGNLIMDDC